MRVDERDCVEALRIGRVEYRMMRGGGVWRVYRVGCCGSGLE